MTLETIIGAADADLSDPPMDTGTTTQSNPDDMDSDDLLLMQARLELEAETNDGQTPQTTQTAPTPGEAPNGQPVQQQTPPAPAPQGDGAAPGRVMIPKERLDEVLSQKTERELRIAFLEGQLAAAQTRGAPPAGGAPAAPAAQPLTLDQQLVNVEAQIVALAEKFDAGDISAKDWKAQELALTRQAGALRDQQLLAKVPQPTAPKTGNDDLYLQDRTNELQAQHPYILAYAADDFEFEQLRLRAQHQLESQGVELKNDAPTKLMLRQAMCEIATKRGPADFPDFKVSGAQPAAPPQPQPGKPSATAQARDAKLDLRAGMPPVLTDIPPAGGGGDIGGYTEAQIEAMNEEDIANLPKAARDRILNRMALS